MKDKIKELIADYQYKIENAKSNIKYIQDRNINLKGSMSNQECNLIIFNEKRIDLLEEVIEDLELLIKGE